LNDSANPDALHNAYLCLGSNIEPAANIRSAVRMLREQAKLGSLSTCWETEAFRGEHTTIAPNFLNAAACIHTPFGAAELKEHLLAPIERALGRVRTTDKYAPRTIDLDITLYDDQVLDPELWQRVYLAVTFSELLPNLRHPETGETLANAAQRLRRQHAAVAHPEILLDDTDR